MKIYWKPLLISLGISLGVAGLSALLTMNSMELYAALQKPPLSPPGWVFGVVWGILYFLMGISSYLIFVSGSDKRDTALKVYAVQLAVNFLWSILFFNLQAYWLAAFWLVLLWVLILAMILVFYPISKSAALLQLPYLLWVTFAGYLSFSVAVLN